MMTNDASRMVIAVFSAFVIGIAAALLGATAYNSYALPIKCAELGVEKAKDGVELFKKLTK